MASLFQGTVQTAPSYASTTADVPKWLQDYTVDLFSQQRAVAAAPYQPYALPRIAQTTAPTTAAYDLIQKNIGAFQPAVSGALSGTQGLAGQTSVSNIGAYMNPFTQNVTDTIAKLGARNLSENLLPAVSDQFVRAGQFGSTGMGTFGGRAVRDTQEAILNAQSQALQQGYTQAQTAAAADLTRQQGALGQVADLAKVQQGLTTADAAALEAIGTAQQAQEQKGLDVGYQDYLKQIGYPQEQINAMSTTLRGLPATAVPTTGTTAGTTTTFGASPLGQLAGAYSLYRGLTGNNSILPGSAKGGLIDGYAEGGLARGNNSLEESVMADYGKYFKCGGRVPGYAQEGYVDVANPAPTVPGGYDPTALKNINPELDAMLALYDTGGDYTTEIAANVAARKLQQEQFNKSMDALKNQPANVPSESEKWFRLAGAFLDPGKTGHFGESLGRAGGVMSEHEAAVREATAQKQRFDTELGLKQQQASLEGLRDEATTLRTMQAEKHKDKRELIKETIKQQIAAGKKPDERLMYEYYAEQERAAGRTPNSWNTYRLEGKRAGASQVVLPATKGETKYEEEIGKGLAARDLQIVGLADTAPKQLDTARRVKMLITQNPITGAGAEQLTGLNSLLTTAGLIDPARQITTETLMSTLAAQTLDNIKASGLGSGQGFTDKDRQFLEKASAGTITMNVESLRKLADLSERAGMHAISRYNDFVDRASDDKRAFYGLKRIEDTGITTPKPRFKNKD